MLHLQAPQSRRCARPSGRRYLRGRMTALATTLVAVAAFVSACSSAGGTTANAAQKVLVVATANDAAIGPETVDGVSDMGLATQATLVMNPYVPSGTGTLEQDTTKFVGLLASGYTVSPNGLTYTFHLRNAVSVAGNPLTAEDVIWSYERAFSLPTDPAPSLSYPVITDPAKQFKAINTHTVSITIPSQGMGLTLLALLSNFTGTIYDAKLAEAHETKSDPWAATWSANHPNNGYGPYLVKSYQTGIEETLIANPHFVLGEPKIKTVVVKYVADAGTRALLLRDGAVQLSESLLPSDLVSLAKGSGTKIGTVTNPNEYLEIPLVTNKAPFNNTLVRQAFAYAVPYQQIINNVYDGLAKRQSPSFLQRDVPGYDGSGFTDFRYDPAMAKELLAEAGDRNGVSFTLTVNNGLPDDELAAIQIQTYAAKAGFKITINQVSPAAAWNGRVNHTFQAFLADDYAITLTPLYELGVYTVGTGSSNIEDWSDPSFTVARERADSYPDELTPAGGRLINAAERIFVNQVGDLFVCQIQPSVAMSSNLEGWAWRSDNYTDFANLWFASK